MYVLVWCVFLLFVFIFGFIFLTIFIRTCIGRGINLCLVKNVTKLVFFNFYFPLFQYEYGTVKIKYKLLSKIVNQR